MNERPELVAALDPLGILTGCTRPDEVRAVIDETLLESRVTGFAVGLVAGLVVGVAGLMFLHVRYGGGR